MNYWITTDWHLNHRNIIEYENRPTNYMELILKHHKEVIKPEDILINLGDVIFGQKNDLKDFMSEIPAKKKILVRGNHDEHNTDTFYYKSGFDCVCDGLTIDYVLLSHAPMELTDYHLGNIHGHFHSNGHRIEEPWYTNSPRHFLLAIESTNYYPVKFQKIKEKLQCLKNIL